VREITPDISDALASHKRDRGSMRANLARVCRTSSQNSFSKKRTQLKDSKFTESDMSKTWRDYTPRSQRTTETPQKAVDRLRESEAREDIHEALAAPQEAARV